MINELTSQRGVPEQSAVELFGEWARLGRDEGMEKGHSPSVEEMISNVLDRTTGRFSAIDVGCGNGWAVRKLAMLPDCYRSSGVDGSEQMIDKARSIDPDGEYFVGKIPEWRPEEKSDLILSMEFIYYLDDPLAFFQTLHDDWISEGGSVALGMDHYLENEDSVSWPESLGIPMTTLSIGEWRDGLECAGFTDVETLQVCPKEGWSGTLVLIGTKA
jgi:SAM-dependent methyltransferase